PPDPDEDDYIEEEQVDRFVEELRKALIVGAKLAAKPKPRAGVPKPLPPPDESFPKDIQIFATFKETKKYACSGLNVGRGLGTAIGKTRFKGVGMPGYGNKRWPNSMHKLVFHHGRDEQNQGQAGIALLDEKRLEAFLTFADTFEAPAFVKEVDGI